MIAEDALECTPARTTSSTRAALTMLGGVALLSLPILAVPIATGTGWSTIRDRIAGLTALQIGVLTTVWLAGLFLHTYVSTGALPDLTHRRAMALNFSGSAVSHLAPFGGVLGMGLNYSMLRSWGFNGRNFTVLTLLTNAYNAAIKLLLPSIALALLLSSGHQSRPLVFAAATSLGVLFILGAIVRIAIGTRASTSVSRFHTSATSLLGRIASTPAHEVVIDVRNEIRTVLRASWRRMTLGGLGYAVLQATLLYLCLAMLGSPLSPIAVFAAFATGSALTLVPLTPGGVGFAEAGMAALLVALGGTPSATAAAVVLYSTFTRLLEIPFGAASTAAWWLRRPAHI